MNDIESEGKSVAEAVENALSKAGLRRDQVEVQIVQEGSAGFMGIGAKLARVRIREKRWAADGAPIPQDASAPPPPKVSSRAAPMPKPERRSVPRPETRPAPPPQAARPQPRAPRHNPDAPRVERAKPPEPQPQPRAPRAPAAALTPEQGKAACEEAVTLLKELLPLMNFEAKVSAQWDAEQERVKAVVETPDAERLIGPDGKTLESLQFLVTLIITRRHDSPIAVWVDTQGYWDKKEKAVLSEAQSAVNAVKTSGKPFRMPPMDAPLRRLIHRSLAGHPDVLTVSEGEGAWRKIVLKPRK